MSNRVIYGLSRSLTIDAVWQVHELAWNSLREHVEDRVTINVRDLILDRITEDLVIPESQFRQSFSSDNESLHL